MAFTVLLHEKIIDDWQLSKHRQNFATHLEEHKDFYILETLIRRARQWFIEKHHHRSIAKIEDNLYRFRAEIDKDHKRILFRPIVEDKTLLGIFLIAQVSRADHNYSNRDYNSCIPQEFVGHNESIETLKTHKRIMLYPYEKIKEVPQQWEFCNYIRKTAITESSYNIIYAPPGAGKTHLIQEMILKVFEGEESIDDFDAPSKYPENKQPDVGCSIQNNIVLVPSDKLLFQYSTHLKHQCYKLVRGVLECVALLHTKSSFD